MEFSFQICFRNQFQTLGSGQTEIMPITPIGVTGVISVWPLPEVWNWFQKQIAHISILIFFLESFDHQTKMFKNGFPIVFSKSDLA